MIRSAHLTQLALTALGAVALMPDPAYASVLSCPPTSPIAGESAMKPFAPGRFKWFKDKHQLHDVKHNSIRPLGNGQDPADSQTCERLRAQLPRELSDRSMIDHTYFDAGKYYLAVFIDRRDPTTNGLRFPLVVVLSKQMKVVTAIVPK